MKMLLLFVTLLTLNFSVGVNSIKCYQCSNRDNLACGDPFAANGTLRECPLLSGIEATMCRKLRQTVDTPLGKFIRITRSCGYISNQQEERDSSCFRASITAASSSKYCTCKGDQCNGSDKIRNSLVIITSLLMTLYAAIGL